MSEIAATYQSTGATKEPEATITGADQLEVGANLELLQIDMEDPVKSKAICAIINYFQKKEIETAIQTRCKPGPLKKKLNVIYDYLYDRLDFLKGKKF